MCAIAVMSATASLTMLVATHLWGGPFQGHERALGAAALAWLAIAAVEAHAGRLGQGRAVLVTLASTAVVVGLGLAIPLLWWRLLVVAVLPVVPLLGVLVLHRGRLLALVGVACAGNTLVTLQFGLDGAALVVVVGVELLLVVVPTTVIAVMKSRLESLRALAEHSARTDVLTGLLNRHGMGRELPRAVAAAAASGGHLGVLVLDLDRFKSINDTFGHSAGDRVLAQVGAAVSARVRVEDVVVRWGGEELAVVAAVPDREGLRALAERLRRTVADLDVPGVPGVTVSIGGASVGPDRVDRVDGIEVESWDLVTQLLDQADAALYEAKRGGRDRVVLVGDTSGRDGADVSGGGPGRSRSAPLDGRRGAAVPRRR